MAKKEFKYDLTIGMIVKNEINDLRHCLETLQPLRDRISCELIITDTGSTDGTQALAKEFADVYLEFEWCNDFSKARNTGTQIAQGRWFLTIDADHWFDESVLEIASFLQNPEVDTLYDAVNLSIRNYNHSKEDLTQYFVTKSPLLTNFTQGRRMFHYPIHESIFYNGEKTCTIPFIMHHWGYLPQNKTSKQDRNLPLMRKLVKNSPKDLKARYQLFMALSDPKEKETFFAQSIKVGIPLAKETEECKIWVMLLRMHYLQSLTNQEQWDKAEKVLSTWHDYIPDSVFQLDFLGFSIRYFLNRGSQYHPKALELFPLYHRLFLKEQAEPQEKYYGFSSFFYGSLTNYALLESSLLQQTLSGEELIPLSQAVGYTFESKEEKHPYMMSYCNFGFLRQDYEFLATLFDFIQEKGTSSEKEMLVSALTNKFHTFTPEQQQDFLKGFQTKSPFLQELQSLQKEFPVVSPVADVTLLKESLLSLLMEKRIEEARPLFLLLQQHSPTDPVLGSLSPLFPPLH